MTTRRNVFTLILAAAAISAFSPAIAAEKAVKPEKNPPGDISDSQVFVSYKSPLGFVLQVPEGWARKEQADGAVFNDKYGRIEVTVADGALPDPQAAGDDLKAKGRAVVLHKVEKAKRPAGEAVYLTFDNNSEPNAVTNKQIRLESDRYLFAANGKVATITFSAPKGADNVDQWLSMSESFKWQ